MGPQTLKTGSSVYKSIWIKPARDMTLPSPFPPVTCCMTVFCVEKLLEFRVQLPWFHRDSGCYPRSFALSTWCSQEDWLHLSVFCGDLYPLLRWTERALCFILSSCRRCSVATAWVRPKQTHLWSLQLLDMWFLGEHLPSLSFDFLIYKIRQKLSIL